ncbi:glycosyltransferase 87 family protein [Tunturiibacter lichenicola]|uniref:glycosyltransferase 87 family protein n=1 Tax=Tunturiibacter lichenicola TaxID=2051959 RepID=UPI0021B225A3|nr:glycosyltransferase 87 family protein [Edaphobacter lichenicola]
MFLSVTKYSRSFGKPIFLAAGAPLPEWVRRAEWLLFALMLWYFVLHTLPTAWITLNTDFPNYYLTARIAREKDDTSRIYEWVWLQRQKDYRQIDQRIIGLVPITPFSTLAVWPLASFLPLTAKHYWLSLNIVMVGAIAVLLRLLTRLYWRHIALVIALSVPINKNFLYGQYYVLLLFTIALACWCYVRQKRLVAGILIGLGFGLKLFPLLYLGYFLRKKDFKAFIGGVVGSSAAAIASITIFGIQANRVLLIQVLPWAMRGEGMNPYDISSASVATLLHRLFVYEPQWNPSPPIHAPWMFAILLPLVQTLLFAPALLLVKPNSMDARRLHLEWSGVLIGSLAISTLPAGYHFTLLILPVCLMWSSTRERAGWIGTAVLLFLFVAIGYPGWKALGSISHLVLLSVPRLYVVLALCIFSYWLLAVEERGSRWDRDALLWTGAFAMMMLLNIALGLRHQHGLYADYAWRIPIADQVLQADNPIAQNNTVLFTAMLPDGYHAASQSKDLVHFDKSHSDQLALAANSSERWTEEVSSESMIVPSHSDQKIIHQAESPVASPDGRWLAFLREEHGRNRIWLRVLDQPGSTDRVITSAELNVSEMSFLPNGSLIFSAEPNGGRPGLFLVDQAGSISSLGPDESRYPAVSPDGHWLAYSQLQGGNWHLQLRNLRNGQTETLTHADCNNVEPAWLPDSKTLIYGSDCGRALWFYALCRRPI